MSNNSIYYFLLSDLNLNVRVKICALQGRQTSPPPPILAEGAALTIDKETECYVTCSITSNGKSVTLPCSTTLSDTPGDCSWNQWLTFPIKYRDLTPTSRLVFTVWEVTHTTSIARFTPVASPPAPSPPITHVRDLSTPMVKPIGGTSLPVFNKKGLLKLGRRKLHLWEGREGDGSVVSCTPYKDKQAVPSNMDLLEKRISEYDQKEMPSIKWLDKLTIKRVEKMQVQEQQRQQQQYSAYNNHFSNAPSHHKKNASFHSFNGAHIHQFNPLNYNHMNNPSFLNQHTQYSPSPSLAQQQQRMSLVIDLPPFKHPIVYHQRTCNPLLPEILPGKERDRVFVLHDPELNRDNPVEMKCHKLINARSSKGVHERGLKPKIAERKDINRIIDSPEKKLSLQEKQLLWKYRFSLVDNKRALTKFLRVVDWGDGGESRQAVQLMKEWTPIDIADALELLSKFFTNTSVRSYAVTQLDRANNEELNNYLLQLVQAIRYEEKYPSVLSKFLIRRCSDDFFLANFFNWFLCVERHDKTRGQTYSRFLSDFFKVLFDKHPGWVKRLQDESKLIADLIDLSKRAGASRGRVKEKIQYMREMLKKDGELSRLRVFTTPTTMAVRPELQVTGILGEKSTMFKSNLAPMLLTFTTTGEGDDGSGNNNSSRGTKSNNHKSQNQRTTDGSGSNGGGDDKAQSSTYRVIFKVGDDLRQDQLIIQMINLMDSLLKNVNLDLKLTPYRVLATSPDDGFVEFVPNSHTLTSILDEHDKDIRKFFQKHNPKPNQMQSVLNTFIKSCAGYCVITYILGIGDRHLDNVLLTTSGHLFHIDFGYIFGRDPKPFPPPMKFCKEMVEAMGGSDSSHYRDFRKYCCLAFNILRQHASLILNLLSLMGDADIPDLAIDVEKNLLKVEDKFRLDLSDEEAETYILALVDESVSALFPQMVEKIHKWALYWK